MYIFKILAYYYSFIYLWIFRIFLLYSRVPEVVFEIDLSIDCTLCYGIYHLMSPKYPLQLNFEDMFKTVIATISMVTDTVPKQVPIQLYIADYSIFYKITWKESCDYLSNLHQHKTRR